jgi:hypothetical protein
MTRSGHGWGPCRMRDHLGRPQTPAGHQLLLWVLHLHLVGVVLHLHPKRRLLLHLRLPPQTSVTQATPKHMEGDVSRCKL